MEAKEAELRERIAQRIYYGRYSAGTDNAACNPNWSTVDDLIKEAIRKEARRWLVFIKELGYCLIDPSKLKVLTDEEINKVEDSWLQTAWNGGKEMQEKLVKLLLDWQQRQGLSDKQFADLLGISRSMISYLRSGKRHLGIDVVRKIWTNIPDRTVHYTCREWFAPPIDFNSIKELDLRDQKQLEELRGMR